MRDVGIEWTTVRRDDQVLSSTTRQELAAEVERRRERLAVLEASGSPEHKVRAQVERIELSALERASAIIARTSVTGDERCERHSDRDPCRGELYARFCGSCGA